MLFAASLFEQIDSNHDGEVDWEELKQHGMVLQRLPEELGELTGDSGKCVAGGKMSRHDFDSFITTSLQAAFKCFDKNNSGVLEHNERLVIYQLFGECHTQFEPQPPMSKQQFMDICPDGEAIHQIYEAARSAAVCPENPRDWEHSKTGSSRSWSRRTMQQLFL